MFRRHPHLALLATACAAATVLAACDRRDPVSPSAPGSQQITTSKGTDSSTTPTTPAKPVSGTPADTAPHATPPSSPPAADSGDTPYQGTVALHGQTVMLRPAPAGSTSDTLVYQPVSGVSISIVSNSSGQTVASAVTDSNGSFVANIPSGSYHILAHPPAGAGAGDASIQVGAGQATEYVQLVLPSGS